MSTLELGMGRRRSAARQKFIVGIEGTNDEDWLGGVTMQRDGELAGKVLFFAGVGPTTALIAARDARRVGQSYPCRLPPIFTMPVAAPSRRNAI